MSAKRREIKRSVKPPESKPLREPLEGETNLRTYHRDQAKNRMLAALDKHLGIVYYACKEAGIARKTHYNWLKVDLDYRDASEEVLTNSGDFVERKLLEAIQEKNTAVMIFYAKTRLRNRGYVERHEFTGANGGEIQLSGNLTLAQAQNELPPSAIEEIIAKVVGGSGNAEKALARLKLKAKE